MSTLLLFIFLKLNRSCAPLLSSSRYDAADSPAASQRPPPHPEVRVCVCVTAGVLPARSSSPRWGSGGRRRTAPLRSGHSRPCRAWVSGVGWRRGGGSSRLPWCRGRRKRCRRCSVSRSRRVRLTLCACVNVCACVCVGLCMCVSAPCKHQTSSVQLPPPPPPTPPQKKWAGPSRTCRIRLHTCVCPPPTLKVLLLKYFTCRGEFISHSITHFVEAWYIMSESHEYIYLCIWDSDMMYRASASRVMLRDINFPSTQPRRFMLQHTWFCQSLRMMSRAFQSGVWHQGNVQNMEDTVPPLGAWLGNTALGKAMDYFYSNTNSRTPKMGPPVHMAPGLMLAPCWLLLSIDAVFDPGPSARTSATQTTTVLIISNPTW